MALFALSCIGLLLFLWISFGGSVPFAARGYVVKVAFPYADQLPTQAEVDIAGVRIGTVIATNPDPRLNRTLATLEIYRRYAPLHRNARAILRIKTLLGETYVEITPGTPSAPPLPDGSQLPPAQVVPAVQLDQIYNTFDPATRRAFQQWQEDLAAVLRGNGQNLNSVLGNLPPFAANGTDLLRVLDVQQAATVGLLRSGGTVFAALDRYPAQLRNLITTGETTLHTTAERYASLAAIFRQFPSFLTQSRLTLARLQSFALNTDPLVRELEPVALQLGPTFLALRNLSPSLRHLFTNLSPLIRVSRTGLPATAAVISGAQPLLAALAPFLEQLNPIFGWLSLHQQLISDFISNGASALAAKTSSINGQPGHYLRQFGPVGPETLSLGASNRDANNRGDTYPNPLWLADPEDLVQNIAGSWDCRNTGAPGNGSETNSNAPGPAGHPACWVQPRLPGAKALYQIPHLVPSITTGGR